MSHLSGSIFSQKSDIVSNDAFFQPDWAGTCWGSLGRTRIAARLVCRLWIVGPEIRLLLGWFIGSGCGTPLQKQERRWIGGGFARGRSDA